MAASARRGLGRQKCPPVQDGEKKWGARLALLGKLLGVPVAGVVLAVLEEAQAGRHDERRFLAVVLDEPPRVDALELARGVLQPWTAQKILPAQVFLPTNNALSPVGHVHWYLEELKRTSCP